MVGYKYRCTLVLTTNILYMLSNCSLINLSVMQCGVISPRFDVQLKDLEKWQNNLLPSRQFGWVIAHFLWAFYHLYIYFRGTYGVWKCMEKKKLEYGKIFVSWLVPLFIYFFFTQSFKLEWISFLLPNIHAILKRWQKVAGPQWLAYYYF